ncbi:phosphate ABC transporter substrate-binding protein, PhoT family [Enterobacteriaceae bacterium strain FGI 57]|nr:phosphate ABC transporter substrate-binding protein, PhoT family [Enterobacteriaceae bacterium strain FGI 57]
MFFAFAETNAKISITKIEKSYFSGNDFEGSADTEVKACNKWKLTPSAIKEIYQLNEICMAPRAEGNDKRLHRESLLVIFYFAVGRILDSLVSSPLEIFMLSMKIVKIWVQEILCLALILPILAILLNIPMVLFFLAIHRELSGHLVDLTGVFALTVLAGDLLGWVRGKFIREEAYTLVRLLPAIIFIFCSLFNWLATVIIADGDFSHLVFYTHQRWFCIYSILMNMASTSETYYAPTVMIVLGPVIPLGGILAYITVQSVIEKRTAMLVSNPVGRYIALVMLLIVLSISGLLSWQTWDRYQRRVATNTVNQIAENIIFEEYTPFSADNNLTPLRKPATLLLDARWPRLDGATALYPLYVSAAQALYRNIPAEDLKSYLRVRTTDGAYDALIGGRADIIFVAEPSIQQREKAKAQGVDLHFYPIAREAFVFITHKDNPITQLTDTQIRAIYSGQINNWREVGGRDARIYAYQRREGSGSQTIMRAAVMKTEKMRKPLETESIDDMLGLMRDVADYQNSASSLGYTFRYYATQLHHNDNIRLLAVNGIAPTKETIRSGKYPYTVNVYMVTAGTPSRQSQKVIDWFLSEQGKQLIADVGYIPFK